MKKSNQKPTKRRKRRVHWGRVALAIFVPAVVIALAVLSLTVFFPIQDIKVKENTVYSAAQILQESGVKKGDNLFRLSKSRVESRLCEKLPYVRSVKLERSLPGTLTLVVEPLDPEYAFVVENGYLLVAEHKALEVVDEAPVGIPTVNLPLQYELGKPIGLSENETSFDRLAKAISDAKLEGISRIVFEDASKITLVYEDRLTLEVGTLEDIEKKLKKASQIIESIDGDYNGHAAGTIKLQYEDSYFERDSQSNEPTSSQTSSETSSEEASSQE